MSMQSTLRSVADAKHEGIQSIAPTESVSDAVAKMKDRNIGALVVLDGERLAGIFSERDYARKVILFGKASKDTSVSEIMTPKVVCVRPEQTAEECMAIMTEKRCRHLPVLVNKKVVGIISIGDVVRAMITDQQQTIEQLEQYIMS